MTEPNVTLRELLETKINHLTEITDRGFADTRRQLDRSDKRWEDADARLSKLEAVVLWFTGTRRLLLFVVPMTPAIGFLVQVLR